MTFLRNIKLFISLTALAVRNGQTSNSGGSHTVEGANIFSVANFNSEVKPEPLDVDTETYS